MYREIFLEASASRGKAPDYIGSSRKKERNLTGRNSKSIWRNVGVYSAEREVNQQMLDNKSEQK